MKPHRRILVTVLSACCIAGTASARETSKFDPQEISAATTKLIAALESPDPTAWVYMYTEDAVLLEPESGPLVGRAKLLELARAMQPMSAVTITPAHTEGDGRLAFMHGEASWRNGRPPQAGAESKVHLAIVWRKEADGQWRVAHEALVPRGATTPQRFVSRVKHPTGQTVVVAEGDDEARSLGSFSVRLYDAAGAPDETTFFTSGLVRARDGVVERVQLADTGGDTQPEVVVIVRSVGSGNYLSAQSFAVEKNAISFKVEVAGLAPDTDPVSVLRQSAPAQQ